MTSAKSTLSYHDESEGLVAASVEQVFSQIDDHSRLSSHMSKPSWRMGGGQMQTMLDEGQGKKVGSRIRLAGRVFGIGVSVDEIVTERIPPLRKVWETTSAPKLLVIGQYRMGFELAPQVNGSLLRVFIDYALPEKAPARWLGYLFSRYYAKWCTQQMVHEAVQHFEATS